PRRLREVERLDGDLAQCGAAFTVVTGALERRIVQQLERSLDLFGELRGWSAEAGGDTDCAEYETQAQGGDVSVRVHVEDLHRGKAASEVPHLMSRPFLALITGTQRRKLPRSDTLPEPSASRLAGEDDEAVRDALRERGGREETIDRPQTTVEHRGHPAEPGAVEDRRRDHVRRPVDSPATQGDEAGGGEHLAELGRREEPERRALVVDGEAFPQRPRDLTPRDTRRDAIPERIPRDARDERPAEVQAPLVLAFEQQRAARSKDAGQLGDRPGPP